MEKIIKSLSEIAIEEMTKLMENSKLVGQQLSTGVSYFEGTDRLLKILKSKKSVKIEINIPLNKTIETEFNLTKISTKMAYEKHLGTMKYFVILTDEKQINKLLKILITEFNKQKIEKNKTIQTVKTV